MIPVDAADLPLHLRDSRADYVTGDVTPEDILDVFEAAVASLPPDARVARFGDALARDLLERLPDLEPETIARVLAMATSVLGLLIAMPGCDPVFTLNVGGWAANQLWRGRVAR